MKSLKSWKWLMREKGGSGLPDGRGKSSLKMKQLPFMAIVCTIMLFIVYRTTKYQYHETEIDKRGNLWGGEKGYPEVSEKLKGLPRGIIQDRTDLEQRPLWSSSSSRLQVSVYSNRNLLAIPVGVKQKDNVDAMVQKFISDNFTVILFHYDGKVGEWWDLEWSSNAIHIVALNQTKWKLGMDVRSSLWKEFFEIQDGFMQASWRWFAKRFLHPDIVSIYDYIFLWDEDLGVENFAPSRYIKIVKEEGLEISQPALHPNSTDIHHRITVRARKKLFHRRVYERRGSTRCTEASEGPPCTGFVEGMAPVFSRAAWYCAWHLIQNDLIHGWGMDMKLGYCAQGDRTKNVGVVDSEYIFHKGIQTLGGGEGGGGVHTTKKQKQKQKQKQKTKQASTGFDTRTEIRRQSTWELKIFLERWNEAAAEDTNWVDPFKSDQRRIIRRRRDQQIQRP